MPRRKLDQYVGKIGNDCGTDFVEHENAITAHVERHPELGSEIQRVRLHLDMMKSHVHGEYILPNEVVGCLSAGLASVVGISGFSLGLPPVPIALADVAILGLIYAVLRGEIDEYMEWRGSTRFGICQVAGLNELS